VTNVTLKVAGFSCLTVVLACATLAQQTAPVSKPGPAEDLYLKLRTVGLDSTKVFKIREASLDRASIHISLDDGMIGFTESVAGHITGAFFEGDGELLLTPPNSVERSSLASFTRGAILEEKFSSAYFRFNDDVYGELKPFLRTADDTNSFVGQWKDAVQPLSEKDALRLLLTFADGLAGDENVSPPSTNDHMLHVMLTGNKLGAFDVLYDSLLSEQIAAGQNKTVAGESYYDLWTAFSIPGPHEQSEGEGAGASPNFEFEVAKFNIQTEIRPPTEIQSKAVLTVLARKDCRRTLVFELSRLLNVQKVLADGAPVEFIHNQAIEGSQLARRGNDVVAIVLWSPLRAGQKIELSFEYSGSVLSEAADGLLYVGDRGTWYPNRGLAMADFDLEFKYPAAWTLAATGHKAEQHEEGGRQVSRWVSERPVPVVGFNLGRYSQSVAYAGKVPVLTYATASVERGFPGTAVTGVPMPEVPYISPRQSVPTLALSKPLPPSPSENVRTVGATSARAVEFYERYFGPYPYGELSITQMPGEVSQGWPGLIYLSSFAFLSNDQRAKLGMDRNQLAMAEQVVAHETAHQWWGDLVGWSSYRDQWIMEALANYSSLMLLESHDPAKFRQIMQAYRDELIEKKEKGRPPGEAGPVTLGLRLSSSQFPNAYDAVCYGRGTWLFHMLRTMLRDGERKSAAGRPKASADEPFVQVLRKLRNDYEGKSVSTQQVMSEFEAQLPRSLWYEGHKSLAWFYSSWIGGSAVPEFDLRGLKFADKGNATTVTGSIAQEHASNDLVTSIPIYASVAGKSVFLGRVFAEGQETQFRLSAPLGTRKVLLDPEQSVLSRNK
jgi:Peptidase family M1 domain